MKPRHRQSPRDAEAWAQRLGVTEKRLKAVTMVGTHLSTVVDFLGQPAP